jgi:hypothetical protein
MLVIYQEPLHEARSTECKLTFLCNKFTFLHLRVLHNMTVPHAQLESPDLTKYFAVSPV